MAKRQVWDRGWLCGVSQRPSPNCDSRPDACPVTLAVVHAISLPPGVWRGDAVQRLFTNALDWDAHPYFDSIRGMRVSAHFLVRRSGRTLQFVSCDQRAWHAGVSRWRGREQCNDWSIGIELEGLDGCTFEPAQYRALARLLQRLSRRYPLREVTGHEHIAPGRKTDPGPGFEWRQLRRLLRGSALQVVDRACPA